MISTLTTFVAFAGALVAFFGLWSRDAEEREHLSTAYTWLAAGDFQVGFEILVDPLSVVMMLIVSGVGGLIVWYSMGYMAGDDEERRFFAYMSLFVFSMLLLVQAGNFLLLLVGWGLVGLASYLLIGFWHKRPEAVAAAKKAFVMNAIGDATFALALVLLIWSTGTLEFTGVFDEVDGLSSTIVNLVALGLLGGAAAKSAQIPLHTWLPDAMEGPTPVSALIHAATMVTAGVYLLVRAHPIFEAAPDIQALAAILGAVTLARRRPRRARAVGHQARHRVLDDVPDRLHVPRRGDRRLRLRDLPPDDARLLQGAALPRRRRRHPPPARRAGHPPDGRPEDGAAPDASSRSWSARSRSSACRPSRGSGRRTRSSRRRSLAATRSAGRSSSRASSASLLTGAYSFRLYFTVFQGEPQEASHRQAHGSERARGGAAVDARSGRHPRGARPRSAVCSRSPASGIRSRTGSKRPASRSSRRRIRQDYLVSAISVTLGIVGLLLARRAFLGDRQLVTAPTAWRLFEHKFYFDELYDALFFRPAAALSNALRRRVEEPVIEGSLDEIGSGTILASDGLARVQSGLLRTYAVAIAFSVCVLVIVFVAVR